MGPHTFTPVRHWDPAPIPRDPNIINFFFTAHNPTVPSARKLAYSFRQGQHYRRMSGMGRGVHVSSVGARDRMHLRRKNSRRNGVKGTSIDPPNLLRDPLPGALDQPEGEDCWRKLISASRSKHRPLIEKSDYSPASVSPCSDHSMEVMSYGVASPPSRSLNPKERVGDSHYCLQTSTELLKVMNRIWNLEEDHASNGALIKTLKMELGNARRRIKELVRDRHERDDLVNKIAEDKLARKSKERGMVRAVTQRLKEELEDERELRHRSEILHRKLVLELSEVRCSMAHALADAEKERKSRKLLEDLCDEFAWGIKTYDDELRAMSANSNSKSKSKSKSKSNGDFVARTDADRLIVRVSELWLDERVRFRLLEESAELGRTESNGVINNKLESEIRKFLKSSRNVNSCASNRRLSACGRNSVESVPMNDVVSAPRDAADGEESECSDSHCFELDKRDNGDFNLFRSEAASDDLVGKAIRPVRAKKKLMPDMRIRNENPGFAAQLNRNVRLQIAGDEEARAGEGSQVERIVHRKSDFAERRKVDGIHGSSSSMCAMENMVQADQAPSGSYYASRRKSSPVREWMTKLLTPADLDVSESSTKLPRILKENSLKAKLLEERQEQV